MGTLIQPPKSLRLPEPSDFRCEKGLDVGQLIAAQEKYVDDLKAWARDFGTGPYAGQEIGFPAGDGWARYIVVSLKPVRLVHIATGDAWQFQYVERLTADDVRAQIIREQRLAALFHNKEKENGS